MRKEKLRILVTDDSAVDRSFLKHLLESDQNITVVGMAKNGDEAIQLAGDLRPDLITMDIKMPGMDGLEAAEKIMQENPTPIVIVSGLYMASDVSMTFEALKTGAVNILQKPDGLGNSNFEESKKKFLQMIWLMSEIKVVRKYSIQSKDVQPAVKTQKRARNGKVDLLCIGASAGGPLVLQKLLKELPGKLPFPVIIVQHVDPGFSSGFAEWLKTTSKQNVKEAGKGEILKDGVIYLAPGDYHIGVSKEHSIVLSKTGLINGCRPSVSYLFNSVLQSHPERSVNILLTGMGADGAQELKYLKDAGAVTIAQNKESSLVFGMPGEAIRLDGATMIFSPDEILTFIKSLY